MGNQERYILTVLLVLFFAGLALVFLDHMRWLS